MLIIFIKSNIINMIMQHLIFIALINNIRLGLGTINAAEINRSKNEID